MPDRVCSSALKIDPELQIDPMGSYRRGEETSGDRKRCFRHKDSNVQLTRHVPVDILISRDPGDGITHAGVHG